ncbi:hypothetical protein [Mycobacterium sp.]|uniref:LppA family lipoprotein n=1 Tax=Mycobacterium sp. TaxID=1785 RepID=UPI0031D01FC6
MQQCPSCSHDRAASYSWRRTLFRHCRAQPLSQILAGQFTQEQQLRLADLDVVAGQQIIELSGEGASKLIPSITSETPREGSGLGYQRPYAQTDAKRYFLPDEAAENVAVSEQDWAKIVQTAKGAAGGQLRPLRLHRLPFTRDKK